MILLQGIIDGETASAYAAAQVLGAFIGIAFIGVAAAHLFGEALLQASHHARAGGGLAKFIATFGLLCVIWGCARLRSKAVPVAVGLYITGAYWLTASSSFANPAVTLARAFTDTFAGIRPVRCAELCSSAVPRSNSAFCGELQNVEFERSMIRELARAGLAAARERGAKVGRPVKLSRHQQQEVIRTVRDGSKTAADAARLFGLHRSNISRLLARATD